VVAATMKASAGATLGFAAGLVVLFIGFLALIGGGGGKDLGRFDGQGIAKIVPAEITRIDWHRGADHVPFQRSLQGTWSFNDQVVPKEIEFHLSAALNFIAVSEPARAISADELKDARLADFGLAPAVYTLGLKRSDGSGATFDFGRLNPVGVSQYVRIIGQPELFVLPRYVGSEWEVAADQAQRLLLYPGEVQGDVGRHLDRWLLSVSISQIWSIDVTLDGRVYHLERDAAGDWLFRHSGQKAHAWSGTSLAEPEQARRIAASLAALEQTRVRKLLSQGPNDAGTTDNEPARATIGALFYARDNTVPVAKFEIGSSTPDRLRRVVRIDDNNEMFDISTDEVNCLNDLLKSFSGE
jgi:hypothetical protein